MTIDDVVYLATTFWASLFTGAALYVTLVEHPARVECGTEIAIREFVPSYRRAATMQALLAVLTVVFSVAAWIKSGNVWWLVGGITLGTVIPLTLTVITPTNRAIMDPSLDRTSGQARELLERWAMRHAVRTALSVVALVMFLILLAE